MTTYPSSCDGDDEPSCEPQEFLGGKVVLRPGDCREVLRGLADNSIDACVTDPPYALVSIQKRFGKPGSKPAKDVYGRGAAGFMGKQWDTGETAFAAEFWAEVLRVLKPGGHVVAFSGTRTYHRMACAIEDAGFETRDQLAWAYGSGFPKSHDVSKGIDKAAGAEREVVGKGQSGKTSLMGGLAGVSGEIGHDITAPATESAREWQGWGTALKPAWEPICLARKPLIGTVAANVLEHGTGAINVDGCRVGDGECRQSMTGGMAGKASPVLGKFSGPPPETITTTQGRWPANIVHDGSDEVVHSFPLENGESPARYYYTAKADAEDRLGSKHPTVKPVDLMQWLCRLVTPPGGTVLDPFAGTGTTGEAAWREGFRAVLVEREEEYRADIARRMSLADAGPEGRLHGRLKAAGKVEAPESLPLFGGVADNDNTPPQAQGERPENIRDVCGPKAGLSARSA